MTFTSKYPFRNSYLYFPLASKILESFAARKKTFYFARCTTMQYPTICIKPAHNVNYRYFMQSVWGISKVQRSRPVYQVYIQVGIFYYALSNECQDETKRLCLAHKCSWDRLHRLLANWNKKVLIFLLPGHLFSLTWFLHAIGMTLRFINS